METDIINLVIGAAQTAGLGLRSVLLPYALPLLGALLITSLTWTLFKHLIGDSFESTIVDGLRLVFMAGFLSILLTAWIAPLPGTSFSVSSFFIDGFEAIKSTILGGNSIDATLDKLLKSIVGLSTNAAPRCAAGATVSDVTCVTTAGTVIEGSQGWWKLFDPVKWFDFGFSFLMRFFAYLISCLMLVFYICVIVLSSMIVEIGLILGPLMVPFLLLKPASFLFDGWLKYMITASLYNVVASIVLVFVAGMVVGLDKVNSVPIGASGLSSQVQSPIALATLVVTAVGVYLMMQIQGITSMLMGGGGVDLSPRLGRTVGSVTRFGQAAIAGDRTNPPAATTATAVQKSTGSRLGGLGARMGSSSAKAVQMRSDRSNGAFGRGKAPRR
jgi:type IV secretory pathway VirB6-like protein